MKKLIFLTVISTFLVLGRFSFGQITSDSAIYWINQKYVNCIDSGKSVCHCQEHNNFLILYLDSATKKLTIDPSLYYSEETVVCDIKQDKKNSYTILPGFGMDTGSIINVKSNQLTLSTPKMTTIFTKIKVKLIESKWIEGDLWRQIGIINCRPLLEYSIKLCSDSTAFPLTKEVLANYISKGQITINCSDDYHYNEMSIPGTNAEFFLVYGDNSINVYKETERDRGEIITTSEFKDCQLFYKTKE
jgi:hypothetical protein